METVREGENSSFVGMLLERCFYCVEVGKFSFPFRVVRIEHIESEDEGRFVNFVTNNSFEIDGVPHRLVYQYNQFLLRAPSDDVLPARVTEPLEGSRLHRSNVREHERLITFGLFGGSQARIYT